MARPDGVVIVSERFWAFARRDGQLIEGRMPSHRHRSPRVPLARGLARLAMSVAPLFRRSGVAKKGERRILLLAIFAPFRVRLPSFDVRPDRLGGRHGRPDSLDLPRADAKPPRRGARAIAAVEERSLESTWEGTAMPSRFSPRCGTNFAALVIPVTVVAERIWPFQARSGRPRS
jgi:hypothetical protein